MTDEQLSQIRERAERGDYHCRDHFGQFDPDEDVLGLLALVDKLRQERDNDLQIWRRRIDDAQAERDAFRRNATLAVERKLEAAEAASARLRTALEEYGRHKETCPQFYASDASDDQGPVPAIAFGPCDCGFAALFIPDGEP